MPWGRIGLTICYDMRFPALYRALSESGASFLTMPSAFTKPTGEAHWHVLLRSRAIENGAFVFAAAQGGTHESKRLTYGHSLIVDPWGEIIAEGGIDPGVIMAKIDPAKVADARGKIRRCSTAAASAYPMRIRPPAICIWCGNVHDSLRPAVRTRPRVRKLVSRFVVLRQAGEARTRELSRLQLGQVEKSIMAPQIPRKGRTTEQRAGEEKTLRATARRKKAAAAEATTVPATTPSPEPLMMAQEAELRAKLKELRDHIKANADNVGEQFPEQARISKWLRLEWLMLNAAMCVLSELWR